MATKSLTKTTRTTTAKTTTKKTKPVVNTEENIVNDNDATDVVENIVEEYVEPVEPSRDALIACHSVFAGTYIFTGERLTYTFEGLGAKRSVQYGDLIDALLTGKDAIGKPYIMIDDADVLELPIWTDIKELYESMYDINEVKNFLMTSTTPVFAREFPQLPVSAQNIIKNLVASGIEDGTFDSINKISVIDEVCHTDLKVLVK